MSSASSSRTVLAAALVAASFSVVLACGSRTGLFGPDLSDIDLPDASTRDVDASLPDAGEDGRVPCIPGRFDLGLATAQLMFVIDRSGSMALRLDGTETANPADARWRILRGGLAQTILPFDSQIAMGAKFFPEPLTEFDVLNPVLACRTDDAVGIAPELGNAGKILGVFDSTEPRGGTPTAEALRIAAKNLAARRAVARTIVLATDGAPNCNSDVPLATCVCTGRPDECDNPAPSNCLDDVRTIKTVTDIAQQQKVPVYVIGIGTERPEFTQVLEQMAIAGGRPRPTSPRHYSAQTPAELSGALESIRDGVARCTYLTPSSPTDPNAISVEIDGVVVPRDPSRTDGWDWVDQEYGALAFFGTACDRAQTGGSKLTGVVRCE